MTTAKILKSIYIEQRVLATMICELYAKANRKNYKYAADKYLELYKRIEKEVNKKK